MGSDCALAAEPSTTAMTNADKARSKDGTEILLNWTFGEISARSDVDVYGI